MRTPTPNPCESQAGVPGTRVKNREQVPTRLCYPAGLSVRVGLSEKVAFEQRW